MFKITFPSSELEKENVALNMLQTDEIFMNVAKNAISGSKMSAIDILGQGLEQTSTFRVDF